MLAEAHNRILAGQSLSIDDMADVVDAMVAGQATDDEIAALLLALREKGETADEVAGAALALRRRMTPIRHQRRDALDTCGTGGDGSGLFNVSTAAAIVAAGAGAVVAKHGNRGITSRSGSADALAQLGVNLDADADCIARCLDDVGLCFCFAPQLHPAMKRVAAIRKQLGVPTIFNLLGPLCNPAGAAYQLLGVGRPELRPLLAGALLRLGAQRAVVVHGEDGLDEVSLEASTLVSLVEPGGIREAVWMPEDFGLTRAGRATLLVDGPEQSAALIRRVLDGEPGPPRDIVVLNAAAAVWVSGLCDEPAEAAARCAAAIDSGAAREKLAELVRVSNG